MYNFQKNIYMRMIYKDRNRGCVCMCVCAWKFYFLLFFKAGKFSKTKYMRMIYKDINRGCVCVRVYLKIIFFVIFQSWAINIWIRFYTNFCFHHLFSIVHINWKTKSTLLGRTCQWRVDIFFEFFCWVISMLLIFHSTPSKFVQKNLSICF